jgi:hypothetical protein
MFIDIFFDIVNLIAFLMLAGYLFKRYAYPALKESMSSKEDAKKALDVHYRALQEQQRIIEQEAHFQEQVGLELLTKIGQWRTGVHRDREHKQEVINHYYSAIKQRVALQQAYQERRALEHEIIPQVLQDLSRELDHEFADQERGKLYLKNLVDRMKRTL